MTAPAVFFAPLILDLIEELAFHHIAVTAHADPL
jgi:hypothetical protein